MRVVFCESFTSSPCSYPKIRLRYPMSLADVSVGTLICNKDHSVKLKLSQKTTLTGTSVYTKFQVGIRE